MSPVVRLLGQVATVVAATALLIELAVVLVSILGRSLLGHGPLWADEASRLALAIIAFIGGAAAYRGAHHTAIRLITDRLGVTTRLAVSAGIEWLVLIVTASTAWQSIALLTASWDNLTPMLQISTGWITLPVTIGLVLIALFALERLLIDYSGRIAVATGVVMGLCTALVAGAAGASVFADNPGTSLTGMILLFFGAILLGMPVSFGMLFATLSYLDLTDTAPLVAVPQAMVDGTGNFILLALPFFIFAGLIMERGGISLRLVRFAMAVVGNVRGGLLQVVVVDHLPGQSACPGPRSPTSPRSGRSCGGESNGRAIARRKALRCSLPRPAHGGDHPAQHRHAGAGIGHPDLDRHAVYRRAAAGSGDRVMPDDPDLCTGRAADPRRDVIRVEGGRLRAVPGAHPAADHAGGDGSRASSSGSPPRPRRRPWPWSMALSCHRWFIARCRPERLFGLAGECANSAGMVLFVLSSASAFAWVLTAANLPQELVVLLGAMGGGHLAFMAGSVVLLIVIGSLLEGLPALIILAPLLLPIAVHMGVDGVQYGIVLILAMGVGAFIPPIGVGFYVSAAVAGSDIESAARTMVPYAVVLVLAVLLIAFVPEITLIVPKLLEGHG